MKIEDSALWSEVDDVIDGGENPVHVTWSATIYHEDDDPVVPLKVVSIDFNEDYLNNYADFIVIEMFLPLGTYAKRVFPYLDNLEIELVRQNVGESSNSTDEDTPPQIERYIATLIDEGNNPVIDASVGNITSEEDLNRVGIPRIKFQLTNKSLEQIRMISVGGIYRNTTGEDVVKAVLTSASKNVSVDEDRKVKGVDMVKASNQKKREQIIIPHGTPLAEVPHHVHYHCGGLYATGLAYYLRGDHWYVFPPYDNTRFNDGQPTLTIINIPANKMPGIERTYRKDGDNLVVIATGQTKFKSMSNTLQLNEGNGIRFADASKMMEDFAVTKGNKTIASRGKTNTEAIGAERKNKMNYVSTALRSINANPFVEYSALASRQGEGITLVWENADRSLIYPGMPVRIRYVDGDEIKDLYGALLGAHEFASLRDSGATATRYVSNVSLSVFVKPLDEDTTTT